MMFLGVSLDVEKDAINLLQAKVESLQYGSKLCLVQ